MADISNKTLAVFLLAAIAVSLGGFIISFSRLDSLTGRAAQDTGNANFSINSTISVAFITSAIDFGTGIVNNSGSHNCTLNSSGPGMLNGLANPIGGPDCIGFNATLAPLRVQNQGTLNVTLNITFNATPAQYIGGTSPELSYRASFNETGACGNATSATLNTTFVKVLAANTNYSICNQTAFFWYANNRTLNIDIGLRIPQDADPGGKKLTITAYASNP